MLNHFTSSQNYVSFFGNRFRFLHPLPSWLTRLLHTPRRMSPSRDLKHEEFFRYTGGRWLWDEQEQLRQRYKQFNVHELKSTAAKSVGARVCVSMIKLAEGGFNKVFRLIMNDGKVVIARIPNPNAGPGFRTIPSEVATMDFVSYSFGFALNARKASV